MGSGWLSRIPRGISHGTTPPLPNCTGSQEISDSKLTTAPSCFFHLESREPLIRAGSLGGQRGQLCGVGTSALQHPGAPPGQKPRGWSTGGLKDAAAAGKSLAELLASHSIPGISGNRHTEPGVPAQPGFPCPFTAGAVAGDSPRSCLLGSSSQSPIPAWGFPSSGLWSWLAAGKHGSVHAGTPTPVPSGPYQGKAPSPSLLEPLLRRELLIPTGFATLRHWDTSPPLEM